jgi:hypothetical protein
MLKFSITRGRVTMVSSLIAAEVRHEVEQYIGLRSQGLTRIRRQNSDLQMDAVNALHDGVGDPAATVGIAALVAGIFLGGRLLALLVERKEFAVGMGSRVVVQFALVPTVNPKRPDAETPKILSSAVPSRFRVDALVDGQPSL